jgi:hypothetical protein
MVSRIFQYRSRVQFVCLHVQMTYPALHMQMTWRNRPDSTNWPLQITCNQNDMDPRDRLDRVTDSVDSVVPVVSGIAWNALCSISCAVTFVQFGT